MEDPVAEIESVVLKVTATHSPDVQQAAFQRYMSQDMGFRHPVCSIHPGPNSRNKVLGVYQRAFQPHYTYLAFVDHDFAGGIVSCPRASISG